MGPRPESSALAWCRRGRKGPCGGRGVQPALRSSARSLRLPLGCWGCQAQVGAPPGAGAGVQAGARLTPASCGDGAEGPHRCEAERPWPKPMVPAGRRTCRGGVGDSEAPRCPSPRSAWLPRGLLGIQGRPAGAPAVRPFAPDRWPQKGRGTVSFPPAFPWASAKQRVPGRPGVPQGANSLLTLSGSVAGSAGYQGFHVLSWGACVYNRGPQIVPIGGKSLFL